MPQVTFPPQPIGQPMATPTAIGTPMPFLGYSPDPSVNWRIKFYDADGIPLSMISFEQIDFGAISYKEIFQNVKTILATPLFSAALERLLGIDQSIVDLPIQQASEATIAIIDALYFWEPRAQITNIVFEQSVENVLGGHLIVNCSLNINNVIFGTDTAYNQNNIFETPIRVDQSLPPTVTPLPPTGVGPPGPEGPAGPPGATGPTGPRGSLWFTGVIDPVAVVGAQAQDMYLNTTTAAIFQYDGSTWRTLFNGLGKGR